MVLNKDNQLVALGETNFRGQRWRFGIKSDDRRRHMYVVGSTGMGKSEFLKNMAIQDIEAGRGIAFIDPHGDSIDDLLDHIPADRIKDVVYFDPGSKNPKRILKKISGNKFVKCAEFDKKVNLRDSR